MAIDYDKQLEQNKKDYAAGKIDKDEYEKNGRKIRRMRRQQARGETPNKEPKLKKLRPTDDVEDSDTEPKVKKPRKKVRLRFEDNIDRDAYAKSLVSQLKKLGLEEVTKPELEETYMGYEIVALIDMSLETWDQQKSETENLVTGKDLVDKYQSRWQTKPKTFSIKRRDSEVGNKNHMFMIGPIKNRLG